MLADTKEQIAAGVVVLGKVAHFLNVILGRTMQISRSTDQ